MPAPKSRRPRSRVLAALLLAVAGAGLVLAGREAWRHETEDPIRDPAAPAATLDIPPGASADWIARQLTGLGFARHPLVFRAFVHLRGVGQSLRAGEYALDSSMSLAAVVDKLVRGDVVRREVTFPEGKNLAEAAEIAVAKKVDGLAFLAAAGIPLSSGISIRKRAISRAISFPTPTTSRAPGTPRPFSSRAWWVAFGA